MFLSGGSALRETSKVLKRYTHNSVHLITPFDSGGSSAVLRDAFQIFGIGDIRNRLMALSDENEFGCAEVAALFSHRLPSNASPEELHGELEGMINEEHPLILAIPAGIRQLVRIHLREFLRTAPPGFDLRGASMGNLALVGSYLVNERNFDSVLYLFSKMVSVRGTVRPMANGNLHLCARHVSGEYTVGQHEIGKTHSIERGKIEDLFLVENLNSRTPVSIPGDPLSLSLLEQGELLCYPMGSFFGSVLANTLPSGVGRAICASAGLKVYIPNAGEDLEMRDYSLGEAVEKILQFVRRDAGDDVHTSQILNYVVIDSTRARYAFDLGLDRLRELGIGVIDLQLAEHSPDTLDPTRLVHALLSLA